MDNSVLGLGMFLGVLVVGLIFMIGSLGSKIALSDARETIRICGVDKIECYKKVLEMEDEK